MRVATTALKINAKIANGNASSSSTMAAAPRLNPHAPAPMPRITGSSLHGL
eukprot:CAMPEP_0194412352 /NCGR_PEP_ID=MMETSP0176-20130528/10817_1 /TAXON_ID=216777 /ORGANISM="Proboscia alata, Strain PI-D3" /LENGTH=50 /DNA_ID=CAMNT_0039215051 /DNA_START=107 /DNA_END=259 /DNA_ORIENTATION=-